MRKIVGMKKIVCMLLLIAPLCVLAEDAAKKSSKKKPAEEHLVDMADKIDVGSFHEAEGSISLYDPVGGVLGKNAVDVYGADGKVTGTKTVDAVPEKATAAMNKEGTFDSGQRLNIRERYTLTPDKSSALYSPTSVINVLTKQMAKYCPKGWNKLEEWSEPVEQDFYMYYTLECR